MTRRLRALRRATTSAQRKGPGPITDDDLLDVAPADPAELYSLVATSSGARPQVFSGVRDTARQDREAEAIFGLRRCI